MYGFLFGGSVLLSAPVQPYAGLALLGIYVALFLRRAPRAYLVAAVLGVALYLLARRRVAHPIPDPVGVLTLLLAPAGVLVGGASWIASPFAVSPMRW